MATKTVLIADDDQALATALAIRCRELGVEAVLFADGSEAYEAVLKQPPDLLILDLNMPGANGLFLYEQLAGEMTLAPIPAIILTGQSDEATVERCNRLGAHHVWKGLDTWAALKPVIQKLLDLGVTAVESPQVAAAPDHAPIDAAVEPAAPRVLVVDDDPDVSKAIKIRLKAHGVEVLRAFTGMQGYWTALKEHPDVIVMDYRMPEGYGNFLLGKLQSHSLTKNTPVVVLTGQRIGRNKDFALERELLRLGATAFLTKPLDFLALLDELRSHIPLLEAKPARSLSFHPVR